MSSEYGHSFEKVSHLSPHCETAFSSGSDHCTQVTTHSKNWFEHSKYWSRNTPFAILQTQSLHMRNLNYLGKLSY